MRRTCLAGRFAWIALLPLLSIPEMEITTLSAAPLEPTVADVRALIASASHDHPRLMVDAALLALLQQLAAGDADARTAGLRTAILASARALLDREPVTYHKTGRRLLAVSREALLRITALGMAYHLEKDPRFVARAERELRAVCAFQDWNPSHFLDTAEMTLAVALGYDWLHDQLSAETRNVARDAIIRLGITPSLDGKQGWVNGTNNWSQVCHAGMVAGALSLLEDEPDLAARVVQRAVVGVPPSMHASFSPDGAYPEGPGYWSYGTTFNVILLDCLRTALGTTFDLESIAGFDRTGDFLAHGEGPTGLSFDYADCPEGRAGFEPALYWLATTFARPAWTAQADRGWKTAALSDAAVRRFGVLALLWSARAPVPTAGQPAASLPLDYVGHGIKPVAIFRSAWNDPNAIYLGVCGGTPGSNHGHMDIGSFVFDALGVRWSVDPGRQEYESLESRGVDLWNRRQDSQRWEVFRLNNHAHSTLVIDGMLQRVDGFADIAPENLGGESPGCTLDLTPVYATQAARVTRTFSLPGRTRLIVRDHLEGLAATGTVRWQMVGSSRVDLQACKLEYSIVSPK